MLCATAKHVKLPKYLSNVITTWIQHSTFLKFFCALYEILLLQSPIKNCRAGTDMCCYCVLEVLAGNIGHVGMEISICHHVLAKLDDSLSYFVFFSWIWQVYLLLPLTPKKRSLRMLFCNIYICIYIHIYISLDSFGTVTLCLTGLLSTQCTCGHILLPHTACIVRKRHCLSSFACCDSSVTASLQS